MNPNQQGYYQPEQQEPVQPSGTPPQPAVEPIAPLGPEPVQPSPVAAEPVPAVAPTVVTGEVTPSQPLAESTQVEPDDESITWTAHEYIPQEKGTLWYVIFGVVIVALLGLSVWTQAWTFTLLILVITVLVIVYIKRPPRELTYSLTDEGLVIDGTVHSFSVFKSFGVIHDGLEYSVMLIPTQRFQPAVTVYFPEEAGEDIVDVLGSRLPMKDLKLDAVDRLVRMLRL